ncbi:MAG: signal peptidase I [Candidatus Aenigmarchaeota archaeon]|nr:signal peptidase I [Candidatus Aenigmarchaeota archaeon]
MALNSTLSTILYIVFGIALAFGVNQGLGFVLSTDMPIVAVESYSMVPTFYKGDILVLQGVPPKDLKVGDIIVFSTKEQPAPIVHRIVEINDDGTFQTKGDANSQQLSFEKSIKGGQVHGKEILIIPYLGWVKIGMVEFILPNITYVIIGVVILIFGYILFQRYRNV